MISNVDYLKDYYMPGEFEPHRGCVMIWPVRPGSWPHGAVEAQKAFEEIARAIADSEELWMCTDKEHYEAVSARFADCEAIHVVEIETDDAWARDVGPTCVVKSTSAGTPATTTGMPVMTAGTPATTAGTSATTAGTPDATAGTREVLGINWEFNAWGGEYDGLYASWDKDNAAAPKMCKMLSMECVDARPFVLEGGSIHSDGEGTLLVTEPCLLSKGRNPALSREEIEAKLCACLGIEKVIWLPYGIAGDETNEHVDNVCAFVRPGEVVLAWTDDPLDPQWAPSNACYELLSKETDAKGRPFVIHKLPIPSTPVCITKEELSGFVFEEGEDMRKEGERLAASYVNFYISNGGIILPQFGDDNDAVAVRVLEGLFPERKVYPIYARPIIVGGGNIHCITQQIPR